MNDKECWNCKQCVIEHDVPICLKRNEAIEGDNQLSCFEKGITLGNESKLRQIQNVCKWTIDITNRKKHNLYQQFFIDRIKEIQEIIGEIK